MPVDKSAEENIYDADKALSHEHTLPEVHWVTHFGHERHEQERSRVCIDHIVDSSELVCEANDLLLIFCGRRASKSMDRIGCLDQSGAEYRLVVDGILRRSNHDDDEVDDIQPNRQVAHPPQSLESPDCSRENTNHGNNDNDNDKADFVLGYLTEKRSIAEHDYRDGEKLLKSLSEVDEVAVFRAEYAQDWVAKTHHWEASGVKADEALPDAVPGKCCRKAKYDEESDSRTETHGGKDRSMERVQRSTNSCHERILNLNLRST